MSHIELRYTSEAAARAYEGESFASGNPFAGPTYGSVDAGAFDLRAIIDKPVSLLPGEQLKLSTGIALNMKPYRNQDGHHGEVRMAAIILPRSGRGANEGLVIANLLGLVDEDYQGEITFVAWARPTSGHINASSNRLGGTPIRIEPNERIGQLMFVPALRPEFTIVNEFSHATERGANGYGSTGKL